MIINKILKKSFLTFSLILQAMIAGCTNEMFSNQMNEVNANDIVLGGVEGGSMGEMNNTEYGERLQQGNSAIKSSKRVTFGKVVLVALALCGGTLGGLFGGKAWGESSEKSGIISNIQSIQQNLQANATSADPNIEFIGYAFIPPADNFTSDSFGDSNNWKIEELTCNSGNYPIVTDGVVSCSSSFPDANCDTPQNNPNGNSVSLCDECNPGYLLSSDKTSCTVLNAANLENVVPGNVIPNCKEIGINENNVVVCTNCSTNYYPSNGNCTSTQPTIQNCQTVENNQYGNGEVPICSVCNSGYNLTPLGDSCVANSVLPYLVSPGNVISNCLILGFQGTFAGISGTNNVCTTCNQGYVPSSDGLSCLSISSVSIPNCSTVQNLSGGNSGSYCASCVLGYSLYGYPASCTPNQQILQNVGEPILTNSVPNCMTYSIRSAFSGFGCVICDYQNGFQKILNGSCVTFTGYNATEGSNSYVPNCLNATNQGYYPLSCTSCMSGFSLDRGVCVMPWFDSNNFVFPTTSYGPYSTSCNSGSSLFAFCSGNSGNGLGGLCVNNSAYTSSSLLCPNSGMVIDYNIEPSQVITNCSSIEISGGTFFSNINAFYNNVTNNITCNICDTGYFPNSNGSSCVSIGSVNLPTGCASILNSLNGNSEVICNTCSIGYQLINGQCITVASIGMCTNIANGACTSCAPNYQLISGGCVYQNVVAQANGMNTICTASVYCATYQNHNVASEVQSCCNYQGNTCISNGAYTYGGFAGNGICTSLSPLQTY